MDAKKEPQRGLEKVYHFFLTGDAPPDNDPRVSLPIKDQNTENQFAQKGPRQHIAEYDRLENTVAQLYVLRDSCAGMYHTKNPDNNLIWFQGAAAILQDAITDLIKTLRFLDHNSYL